jgi:hypothetical protein
MSTRKCLRLGLVAVVVAAAGCAPVSFSPGMGFGVSVGPTLSPSLSSCSLLGQSSLAARLGLSSSATQMGEMRNRVAAIQSKYMLSANSTGGEMQSWKQVASGECR